MKYLYTAILTTALLVLPVVVSAEADPHTNITPIEEYVSTELESFQEYIQRPDLTTSELLQATADIIKVLEAYIATL